MKRRWGWGVHPPFPPTCFTPQIHTLPTPHSTHILPTHAYPTSITKQLVTLIIQCYIKPLHNRTQASIYLKVCWTYFWRNFSKLALESRYRRGGWREEGGGGGGGWQGKPVDTHLYHLTMPLTQYHVQLLVYLLWVAQSQPGPCFKVVRHIAQAVLVVVDRFTGGGTNARVTINNHFPQPFPPSTNPFPLVPKVYS